jgi:hypothetical protein
MNTGQNFDTCGLFYWIRILSDFPRRVQDEAVVHVAELKERSPGYNWPVVEAALVASFVAAWSSEVVLASMAVVEELVE